MTVQPVQPNTNNNRASYFRAGALGVIGGMAAKYLIPVSKNEVDVFKSSNPLKNRKKLTSKEIVSLAKAARSTFDFAVITALTLMAVTLFKNMYNKLADKS